MSCCFKYPRSGKFTVHIFTTVLLLTAALDGLVCDIELTIMILQNLSTLPLLFMPATAVCSSYKSSPGQVPLGLGEFVFAEQRAVSLLGRTHADPGRILTWKTVSGIGSQKELPM
ncbi:hypothetical protein AVEN_145199-1 [Araneus ventricosus]|uniref:Uncharacterized protein n=1 Tax=Araneus ventricosus TaxID=182803 RepID=A0A4Y2Q5J5_ARAVE|nr:hypothetical protein AVEN_145199-1 [Araneus ventricosus]